MKKNALTVLLGLLLIIPAAWASGSSSSAEAQSQTTRNAVEQEKQRQDKLLEKVNTDVVEGMDNVIKAVNLLKEGKDTEALSALQSATGKFDLALAANPDLALVPVDGYVTLFDLITTPDAVEKQIKNINALLDEGSVQEARELLSTLRDEMVVSTVYLPMGTYPDAIKLATKYLVDKKRELAIAVLDTTITSLVTKSTSIPLGLIRAQSLIDEASRMNKERDKEKILKLVNTAREQLEISDLLGYTKEYNPSYIDLKKQIANLEKEIMGKNAVEKLYEKLADSFTRLLEKETSSPREE